MPSKSGSLYIQTPTKCPRWMNAHNPVNLTYGGKKLCLWGGWVEEIAWGLVWLSQLILYGMLKLTDDFPGDLLWFTGKKKKNQIALHLPWVGSKINVFGLQMAHKGILIYSVLWCITAQSDISNGVGCVQVNWSYSHYVQQSEAENLVSVISLLSL